MKPTSYDLLIEVTKSVNRVEEKLDKRIDRLDDRLQLTETKLDQMMGKIGVGLMIITLAVSAVISFVVDIIKRQIWK